MRLRAWSVSRFARALSPRCLSHSAKTATNVVASAATNAAENFEQGFRHRGLAMDVAAMLPHRILGGYLAQLDDSPPRSRSSPPGWKPPQNGVLPNELPLKLLLSHHCIASGTLAMTASR
jgi:hypothetical protein